MIDIEDVGEVVDGAGGTDQAASVREMREPGKACVGEGLLGHGALKFFHGLGELGKCRNLNDCLQPLQQRVDLIDQFLRIIHLYLLPLTHSIIFTHQAKSSLF